MPGYVIHLAEAMQILEILRENAVISEDWKQRFLTGTLLPDTLLKKEKYISHFWNPKESGLLAQAPDLSIFLEKYGHCLEQPVLLGYLAHLHLDKCYVHDYWPTVIKFYDKAGRPEILRERIESVEILRLHRRVPVCEFFSPEYYYGEYTKLNRYFIDKYRLTVPDWEGIDDFTMDEVKLKDMRSICQELAYLLSLYYSGDEKNIQIFDLERLEAFIADTALAFTQMMEYVKDKYKNE